MTEIVAAIVGATGAILVWYLTACSLRRQDRDAKKREIRLRFLIDAYRQMENSANREGKEIPEALKTIELAISDVQLFGTRRQVALAQEIVSAFAAGRDVSFNGLLNELRRDLRSELDLESLADERKILRFTRTEDSEQRCRADAEDRAAPCEN